MSAFSIMQIYLALVAFFLVVFALVAVLNTFTFPRLGVRRWHVVGGDRPFVSVLIPARNEAAVIAETVRSWLGQTYSNFELLILDDQSNDGTVEVARRAAAGDPRLRLLSGAPLPQGWKGKNWACHQLSQVACGEILVFTDADVRWRPEALDALLAEMTHSRADLLTVWPTQETHTWGERLVVSLIGFAVMSYLPVWAVHYLPWPIFSAAMGQCLAFRRSAYEQIGGHAAVHASLLEDMALGYAIKRARMRLRAADGAGLIVARMYHNWREVREGFAKNIIGGYANSVALVLLSTVFHWSLFIFPWFWFFFEPFQGSLLIALGVLTRALTAAVTRQRIGDALLLPVSVFLMTIITVQAIYWHFTGGPRWKGRVYGR
ncbi:MAG: glycosyltransferase [Anaerolineales bacterium]|nr:glycosyltransferase [Anaerolineales bacterium]